MPLAGCSPLLAQRIDGLLRHCRPRVEQCVSYFRDAESTAASHAPAEALRGERLVAGLGSGRTATTHTGTARVQLCGECGSPKNRQHMLDKHTRKPAWVASTQSLPQHASKDASRRARPFRIVGVSKMQHLWPHTLPIPSCARRRKRIARKHTFEIRACPSSNEGLP